MNRSCLNSTNAELVIRCKELESNQDFFETIGFQLESIFPADAPRVAVMSGFGLRLRLVQSPVGSNQQAIEIRIADGNGNELSAPCGARVVFSAPSKELVVPEPEVKFQVSRSELDDNWVAGRAGMRYRDLIPGRLGGYLIASHIHVPDAGPVPDYVHHHSVVFQIIFCRTGWARLVYEDQGEPFLFEAGDCVLQPPGIRHRVLESSENLEVIEVSCPAEHVTYADNIMELPNGVKDPDRIYNGQQFVWSRASEAHWSQTPDTGMEYRDTGIGRATNGTAGVRVLRCLSGGKVHFQSQNDEITFCFILNGSCSLRFEDTNASDLKGGDAAMIPGSGRYSFEECSDNLEILEIKILQDS